MEEPVDVFWCFLGLKLTLALDDLNAVGRRAFMKNEKSGILENTFETNLTNLEVGKTHTYDNVVYFLVKVSVMGLA